MKNLFDYVKNLLPSGSKDEWDIAQVTLFVENIHSMKRFYTQVLGMTILQDFETEILLGLPQGSIPMIRLITAENSGIRKTNLTYYLGFEIPKKQLLGDLSNHFLLEEQMIMATCDDGYSEGFYIMDPEQNRLKFYCVKKDLLLEDVNHEMQYLEGNEVTIPIQEFLQLGDTGVHGLPAKTRLNQVHYIVEDIQKTSDFLTNIFQFKTTYDYVAERINFQFNDHYYSIAINEWQAIDPNHTMYGVREIMFFVPEIKVLESIVDRLEEMEWPYLYQDSELKVLTPDHIRYHFKVGERL